MDKNEASLLAFPFLQIATFAAGCYYLASSWLTAAPLILLASLLMSFSLHITYHYHVHFKRSSSVANRLLDLVITVLLGVPFHFYQMLHWNHHKHDNGVGDFTSTWKEVNGVPVPRNLFAYSFLWPLSSNVRGAEKFRIAAREGYLKPRHRRPLAEEAVLLVGIYGALLYLGGTLALAYLAMVYFGWCFIAMHNYGQHLPEIYGDTKGNSYYNRIYNKLTIYNGLHYEHHHRPSVKYWDLQGPSRSRIDHPHLVEGFFFSLRSRARRPGPASRVESAGE